MILHKNNIMQMGLISDCYKWFMLKICTSIVEMLIMWTRHFQKVYFVIERRFFFFFF